VHAIQGVVSTLHLTQLFVGVVIVAIIGNAAEHGIAVVMAWKRQTDLALNVAMSSSTQIALFVAPVLVIAGWFIGKPMSLVFHPFEVMAVGISILIAGLVSMDGESNWFEGVMLLAVYIILSVAFFFLR
jgi:Ca2+:H+ antiporter